MTTAGAPPPPRREVVHRVDITGRTILWVLAGLASVWLLAKIWPVLILILLALVLVGTLNPMIALLERHGWRRTFAIAAVFTAGVIGVGLLGVLTVPVLFGQVIDIFSNAPAHQARLVHWLGEHSVTRGLARNVADIDVSQLASDTGHLALAYSQDIVEIVGGTITAVFLAAYLIADRERVGAALFATIPRRFHLRISRILLNLETIVGGYVRGQLITSGLMTAFSFALLTILGVPNALALAAFAGIMDTLPFVGGLIGGAPMVLAALGGGAIPAIVVLVGTFVYQELESRVIVPRVYGRVLRLSAAAVIVSLLIGASLLGVLGALLALPVAAGVRMIFAELRIEMPGDDSDDSELRVRDEAAEREYERRSSGAGAGTAAQIALEIAHEIRDADAADAADGAGDDGESAAAEVPITDGLEDHRPHH